MTSSPSLRDLTAIESPSRPKGRTVSILPIPARGYEIAIFPFIMTQFIRGVPTQHPVVANVTQTTGCSIRSDGTIFGSDRILRRARLKSGFLLDSLSPIHYWTDRMVSPNSSKRGSKATFSDVCTLESLFRHKWTFLILTGLGLVATGAYLFGRDRAFDSTARVFIRLGRESVPDTTTVVTGHSVQANDPQRREIQSAIDMIRSNSMMEGIVDRIGVEQILNYTDEFTESNAPNPFVQSLKEQIPAVKKFLASIRLVDPENRRAKAIERLEKRIRASNEEHSNVLSVRIRSESPKLSQEIGKILLEKFQELHRTAHEVPGAYSFFDEQLASVKSMLDDKMSRLRDAKNESGISSIENQKQVLTELLKGVELSISNAISDVKGTSAKLVDMKSTLETLPERVLSSEVNGLTNTSKDDMRNSLYHLEVEYADLRMKYTDDNPRVRLKKQQLDEAKAVFVTEKVDPQKTMTINPTYEDVKVRHMIAKAEEAGSSARVNELKQQRENIIQQIREINRKELEIETLTRDIAVLNEKYRKYAENMEQSRIDNALQQGNLSSVNIIQEPNFNDDPVDTSNSIVFLIGSVGSVLFGLGGAFGKRYLRNDLSSADDIERELEIPVLASIPVSKVRRVQFC